MARGRENQPGCARAPVEEAVLLNLLRRDSGIELVGAKRTDVGLDPAGTDCDGVEREEEDICGGRRGRAALISAAGVACLGEGLGAGGVVSECVISGCGRTGLLRRGVFSGRGRPGGDEPRGAGEQDHAAEVDEAEDENRPVPATRMTATFHCTALVVDGCRGRQVGDGPAATAAVHIRRPGTRAARLPARLRVFGSKRSSRNRRQPARQSAQPGHAKAARGVTFRAFRGKSLKSMLRAAT